MEKSQTEKFCSCNNKFHSVFLHYWYFILLIPYHLKLPTVYFYVVMSYTYIGLQYMSLNILMFQGLRNRAAFFCLKQLHWHLSWRNAMTFQYYTFFNVCITKLCLLMFSLYEVSVKVLICKLNQMSCTCTSSICMHFEEKWNSLALKGWHSSLLKYGFTIDCI